MSDYWVPMIVCDKCMPGVAFSIVDGKCDMDLSQATGYCIGIPVDTAIAMGWEECDYGHLCFNCAKMEAETSAADLATGVVSGPTGVANLLRPDLPIDTDVEQEVREIIADRDVEFDKTGNKEG